MNICHINFIMPHKKHSCVLKTFKNVWDLRSVHSWYLNVWDISSLNGFMYNLLYIYRVVLSLADKCNSCTCHFDKIYFHKIKEIKILMGLFTLFDESHVHHVRHFLNSVYSCAICRKLEGQTTTLHVFIEGYTEKNL